MTFDLHGVAVEVRSNRSDLLALVARRLQFFAGAPAVRPEARFELQATEAHVVSPPAVTTRTVYEPETGEVLYDEGEDELYVDYGQVRALCRLGRGEVLVSVLEPVAEAAWAATRPLFTLPLLELLKRRSVYSVHAAGVSSGQHAVVIPGGSGAGKTTLALALVRGGFDFLGDDMLFLSRDGGGPLLLAFPDELDVSETTASFFPDVVGALRRERLPGAVKRQLPANRLPGEVAERARPAVLLFPRIEAGGRSRVEPLTRDEALLELAPNVLLTEPASSQLHLDALGGLVRGSRCFRLSVARDFDDVVEVVGGLVSGTAT